VGQKWSSTCAVKSQSYLAYLVKVIGV
jgi:hypothetical protein